MPENENYRSRTPIIIGQSLESLVLPISFNVLAVMLATWVKPVDILTPGFISTCIQNSNHLARAHRLIITRCSGMFPSNPVMWPYIYFPFKSDRAKVHDYYILPLGPNTPIILCCRNILLVNSIRVMYAHTA